MTSKTFTITGNARAWLTDTWRTPKDMEERAKTDPDAAVSWLSFTTPEQDMTEYGWIEVGMATITATINDTDAVNAKQVQNLKAQIQEIQAKAHEQVRVLEDRIQSLLAITYEEPANE